MFYAIVYKLAVLDQTMCAGGIRLDAIIMFQLLLVRYCSGTVHCFGFGWGGPVTLTRAGPWRACPHLCWEKVLISSSFVF